MLAWLLLLLLLLHQLLRPRQGCCCCFHGSRCQAGAGTLAACCRLAPVLVPGLVPVLVLVPALAASHCPLSCAAQ
jgi:hypothetical protein